MSNACMCIITRGLCCINYYFYHINTFKHWAFQIGATRLCSSVCIKCVCVTGNDYRFDSHQFNSSLIKTKAQEMTAINTVISVSV